MIIIILAIVILLIVFWLKMVKHGSKNINNAVNQINDIKADNARMKAAGITKEDLKRIKRQNIERRKAGLPYWIGMAFLSKKKCGNECPPPFWLYIFVFMPYSASVNKCSKKPFPYETKKEYAPKFQVYFSYLLIFHFSKSSIDL